MNERSPKLSGVMMALMVAGLASAAGSALVAAAGSVAAGQTELQACTGANSCKGQGSCKGEGFVALPKATCDNTGGKSGA